jgi:hypothetical protein
MHLQSLSEHAPTTYETTDWQTVELPSVATVGAVEDAIEAFYRVASEDPSRLCIDLSAARYIEIASLQTITALIAARCRRDLITKLRLPAGASGLNARHFLRRWQFAEALQDVTRKSFPSFVDKADLKYFAGSGAGDIGDPYAPQLVKYSDRHGEVVYSKESYRFFKFTTWQLSNRSDKAAIIEDERRRWKSVEQVVVETLRKSLRIQNSLPDGGRVDTEKYLVGRVMLQAMTNSLRHPRASVLQASSHMAQTPVADRTRPSGFTLVDRQFTLVYWDDGNPMHSTLRRALNEDRPIHFASDNTARYLVVCTNEVDKTEHIQVKQSDDIPTRSASDEDLFLATLYPGVTRDVSGQSRMAPSELEREDRLLAVPGHGLFVLVQAVVELMRGTVSFRCGDLFMNVSYLTDDDWIKSKKTGRKPSYRVKIRRLPEFVPGFLGNMVTVRLPLNRTTA